MAEAFQATGAVRRSALLTATSQFAESVVARGIDVVVADALVPFVPTLLAMGHSDQAISAFVAEPGQALAPMRPVMVFLDGNAGVALSRAAA